MARRRQEVALQVEIESQEEWNDVISKEGLTVADIYQSYGGPCRALEAKFRSIKNTLGDSLLNFAIAKADTIDSLEQYRGRCEPLFLFYATGVLVDAVHGANAPELQRKIISNLEKEKKILKEGGTREEYKFEREDAEEEAMAPAGMHRHRRPSVLHAVANNQFTLAIVRPQAVADGKVEEIIDQIEQNDFRVVLREETQISENNIRTLHRHMMNEDGYEEHIQQMISGPSVILFVQKNDEKQQSLDDFRDFVSANDALKPLIDCTRTSDHLNEELQLLFPALVPKSSSPIEKSIERTLALIRPSALKLFKDAIVGKIQEAGFEVVRTAEITLSRGQVEEFYASKKDKPYFEDLVAEMTSGPSMALYLIKRDAIKGFRSLLGPADKAQIQQATGTFRKEFDIVDAKINSLHGAKTKAQANRNIQFFFPEERLLVILKPKLTDSQRADIEQALKKAGFFTMAKKSIRLDQEQATRLMHQHHGKDQHGEIINYMTSDYSHLYVIAKEDASRSWQAVVGSEDPAEAAQKEPTSLRALYGQDLVHNAIEISPDIASAKADIEYIFGDIDTEDDS